MAEIITPKQFTRRDLLRLASIGIVGAAVAPAKSASSGTRGLLAARGMAMGGGKKLPYDYEVEYLEIDTTGAYFVTGVPPWTSGRIEMSATAVTDGDKYLIGSQNGYNSKMFRVGYQARLAINGKSSNYGSYPLNVKFSLLYEDRKMYVDGALVRDFSDSDTFSGSRYFFLFALNNGGSAYGTAPQGTRIGRTVIVGESNSCSLVPCVKDGVPCYYDETSETFLYKSGSGSVIAGPRI